MKCDDCVAVAINGVPCHEHGCPSSHIDLATGKPYPKPCDECDAGMVHFSPAEGEYEDAECWKCDECDDCKGTGDQFYTQAGAEPVSCDTCGGSGRLEKQEGKDAA